MKKKIKVELLPQYIGVEVQVIYNVTSFKDEYLIHVENATGEENGFAGCKEKSIPLYLRNKLNGKEFIVFMTQCELNEPISQSDEYSILRNEKYYKVSGCNLSFKENSIQE